MIGYYDIEEDLIMDILKGVGDEIESYVPVVWVHDTMVTFIELFDKLEDLERRVKRS